MRRAIQIIVLAAFVFSCGGHWYVLQAVAWVNMIRDYSHFVPLGEAVRMTFSGKYPCAICKAIAEKKQSENDRLGALAKYDKFFPPLALMLAILVCAPVRFPRFSWFWSSRSDAPPTPPPRLALA
jgi:hypothetical protein